MELFLDTANIDEIQRGARLGVVRGVTTNPSLAAKEGIGKAAAYKSAVQEISRIIDGPISVEVISSDVEGMIDEGRDIAGWIPNPWVKLPSTQPGLEAMAVLVKDNIKINQTLCFSFNQALMGFPCRRNRGESPLWAGWTMWATMVWSWCKTLPQSFDNTTSRPR